ncbi:hypothetical protein Slala03_75430 [Streptomyces lavendulae subsp. lavendulae]|nr:hypothetical protein Slala03_75430 [Streptomyces lavendulae subsp. lavendulae]
MSGEVGPSREGLLTVRGDAGAQGPPCPADVLAVAVRGGEKPGAPGSVGSKSVPAQG